MHDFSRYAEAGGIDRRAVDALAGALEGTGKPLAVTSGTLILAPGRVGTETDAAADNGLAAIRAPSEEAVLAAAGRGVRSSVVRLPPSVHGSEDRGFVPVLIDVARRAGFSAFVGEGENRWPAVHRLDAARLFRLALERAEPGARLHGVAEEGIPFRAIAEAIGVGLGLPVRGIPAAEAEAHWGWLGAVAPLDAPASSRLTRERLGWEPRESGLVADLREGGYFATASPVAAQ